MRAKQEKVKLKFSQLGYWKNLHIELFADASLGNLEKNCETKSMMGYFIAISNNDGRINPLHWKSKVIDKVAEDIKTAETLALENALDDSIYLARMISEVYSGDVNGHTIPIVVNEDSKSLVESLFSTKKVKRKTMRVVISSIQQHMRDGIISDVRHVRSKDQLADIFTKKGVSCDRLLEVIHGGNLN